MDFSYFPLLNDEEISLSHEENLEHLEDLEENLISVSKTQSERFRSFRCKKSIIWISSSLLILSVLCGAIIVTFLHIRNYDNPTFEETKVGEKNMQKSLENIGNYDYPTFEEIEERMKNLQKSLEKIKNVSIITVGHSIERNPIRLLSISPLSEVPAPEVWVVCGVHAREWTVPFTCLHFLEKLNTIFHSTEPSPEDNILSSLRYKFILVANPDGYIYSMSGDRMARKNRHLGYCSDNDGVDINRNFPVGFEKNDHFCSDTYAGPEPFSEPESRALRDSVAADVSWLFLSVHVNA